MTGVETLTPRQVAAVEAVLESDTREQAAMRVGISERTLRRWSAMPPFAAELRRQRTRVLDGVASAAVSGSATCMRVLVAIGAGKIKADPTRVQACRCVVDFALRLEEQSTLAARISDLEAQVSALPNAKGSTSWRQ
jgi:hypothetical protein